MAQRSVPIPAPGPARRLWGAITSTTGFRRLAGLNLFLLWLIIPSGGIVRLTDSGLGCTDWPLCDNANVVPEASYHAWIEYTNRMVSLVVIGVSVLTWLAARRADGRPDTARRAALVAALGSVGQIPLGGITVLFDLHPLLVASHFLLSIVALTAGVLCFISADDNVRGTARAWSPRQGPLAAVTAAALLAVVVTGVLVTSAGPHSGDPEVIRRFGRIDTAAYVHVRAVIVFCCLAALLALWVWRRGTADRATWWLLAAFVPVLAAQITIGEVQWRVALPWQLVSFHVTIAGLVWVIGTAIAWRLMRPAQATATAPAPAPVATPVEA